VGDGQVRTHMSDPDQRAAEINGQDRRTILG
jgi:hypothetical protein